MRILIFISFFLSALLSSPQIKAQLTNGLLVNYQFNNDYIDASSNGYDAIPFGTSFSSDRFGNNNSAVFFDGVDDFVEMANVNALKPDFPFSMSLWINPSSVTDPTINTAYGVLNHCFVENNYHGGWIIITNDGRARVGIGYGDGSGCTGPPCRRSFTSICGIRENIWIHIVAIWDSPTSNRIFINNELQMTTTSGSGDLNIAYDNVPGVLGKTDSNSLPGFADNHFFGAIDDFQMWDRVLTENEIAELYDFNAPPLIDFTASADSVSCNVEEVPLVIQAAGNYDYTLDNVPISINNLPNLEGGTYVIEASNGTCTATQILEVPFDTLVPSLDINIGNITCENPSAQLSASFHPDILSYNWWSVSGSLIAQGEDAEIDEVGNYFLIAVADNGCTQTYEFEITENLEEPTVSVSATEITCASLAQLTATQENNNYTIRWTRFGVFVSDSFSFMTDQEGVYTATVTDTINGCTTETTVNVVGNVIPITGIDFELEIECGDFSALFVNNGVLGGVGPYTVNTTAINVDGDEYFPLGQNSIQILDAQGCEYDTSFTVEALPDLLGFTYELGNDCEIFLKFLSDFQVNGGTAPFQIEHSGMEIDDEIFFDEGDHFIRVIDSNQCEIVQQFDVGPVYEVNGIEFTWAEPNCGDDSLALLSITDNNPLNLGLYLDGTSGNINYEPLGLKCIKFAPGEHYLGVRGYYGLCPYDTTFIVSLPIPINDVEYSLSQGCETGQAEFQIDNISGGTAPYSLEAQTGTLIGENYFFDAGSHTITVEDIEGCSYQIDIEVDPVSALTLADIPDMEVDWPELVELEMLTNRMEDQIIVSNWAGYDMFSCTDCLATSLTPDQDVTIRYSIEDMFGCFIEKQVLIRVNKNIDIYTPNIFSPNDDGQNDFFNIFPRDEIVESIVTFNIYDRWGNLVHDAGSNIEPGTYQGWDGKMNNTNVVDGVYVYYYEVELINGERVSKKGDLTVVR